MQLFIRYLEIWAPLVLCCCYIKNIIDHTDSSNAILHPVVCSTLFHYFPLYIVILSIILLLFFLWLFARNFQEKKEKCIGKNLKKDYEENELQFKQSLSDRVFLLTFGLWRDIDDDDGKVFSWLLQMHFYLIYNNIRWEIKSMPFSSIEA